MKVQSSIGRCTSEKFTGKLEVEAKKTTIVLSLTSTGYYQLNPNPCLETRLGSSGISNIYYVPILYVQYLRSTTDITY